MYVLKTHRLLSNPRVYTYVRAGETGEVWGAIYWKYRKHNRNRHYITILPPTQFLDLPLYLHLPMVEDYKNQSYIVVPILAVQSAH